MVIQPEDSVDADFAAYTGNFGLVFKTYFLGGDFNNLNLLIDKLKNKKF